MGKRPIESEILKDVLGAATQKYGADRTKELRPSLESMAKAIWEVENYELASEQEPAFSTRISQQQNSREKAGKQ